MTRLVSCILVALVAVLVGSSTPAAAYWVQQATLQPSTDFGMSGMSLALDGDTAIVGAVNHYGLKYLCQDYVTVHAFARSGSTWTEEAVLRPSDPADKEGFGRSVAISGNTAVVSGHTYTCAGLPSGGVYVFARTNGVWVEQARLQPVNEPGYMPYHAAVSGDRIAVVGSGGLRMFTRYGTAWVQEPTLLSSDAMVLATEPAKSVALDGDTIAVARWDTNPISLGHVHVLRRDSTMAWVQEAALTFPVVNALLYGYKLEVAGDTVLVSDFSASEARVFERVNGVWALALTVPDASTAISDDAIAFSMRLIGAPPDPYDYQIEVFQRLAGVWTLAGQILDVWGPLALYGDTLIAAGVGDEVRVFVDLAPLADGSSCSAGNQCASGSCVDGVCCNSACGGGDGTDCQACSTAEGAPSDGICVILNAGRQCRAAQGVCDVAEVCDGVSPICPADILAAPGAECRAATGPCDLAETCDDVSPTCPMDAFAAPGAECRAATGPCDIAEMCDGVTGDCPSDAAAPAGAVCRSSTGECDMAESCDGVAMMCPPDDLALDGSPCSQGVCFGGVCTGNLGEPHGGSADTDDSPAAPPLPPQDIQRPHQSSEPTSHAINNRAGHAAAFRRDIGLDGGRSILLLPLGHGQSPPPPDEQADSHAMIEQGNHAIQRLAPTSLDPADTPEPGPPESGPDSEAGEIADAAELRRRPADSHSDRIPGGSSRAAHDPDRTAGHAQEPECSAPGALLVVVCAGALALLLRSTRKRGGAALEPASGAEAPAEDMRTPRTLRRDDIEPARSVLDLPLAPPPPKRRGPRPSDLPSWTRPGSTRRKPSWRTNRARVCASPSVPCRSRPAGASATLMALAVLSALSVLVAACTAPADRATPPDGAAEP